MPELKVQCDCGQKYKFDVEPVNGRMPFTVSCPVCGADGTQKANAILQQMAPGPAAASPIRLISEEPTAPIAPSAPAVSPGIVPPISSPAAPPSAPAVAPLAGATAPPPAGGPKLRISGLAPAPPPGAGGTAPPSIAAPSTIGAPRTIGAPPAGRPFAPGAAVAGQPEKKGNFWMGILGAFLGSTVGGALYYLLLTLFGLKSIISMGLASIPILLGVWIGSAFLTIGVGYLAGAGAAFLGKGEGSKELGGIAAVFALAGIIAGQYFIAVAWWHQARNFATDSLYSMSVDNAKEVVAAVPTGSDAEIRSYLAKQASDEGDDSSSNSITADQIKQFRDEQLPEYQGLASGKTTKEQFFANLSQKKNGKHRLDTTQDPGQSDDNSDEGTVKAIFLALLLRKTNIFMLIAAASLAYKISANA